MSYENQKKSFVAYLDEENNQRTGFFVIKSISEHWVELEAGNNILKIPQHRILKIKEQKGDE